MHNVQISTKIYIPCLNGKNVSLLSTGVLKRATLIKANDLIKEYLGREPRYFVPHITLLMNGWSMSTWTWNWPL